MDPHRHENNLHNLNAPPPPLVRRNPPLPPQVRRNPPTQPQVRRNPLTQPQVSRNPPTQPQVRRNPLTQPQVRRNPPTQPQVRRNPPTQPQVRRNPPTQPPVRRNPPTQPQVRRNPPTQPQVSRNPPTQPQVRRNPPTQPQVRRNPPTQPQVRRNPPTQPQVSRNPATQPQVRRNPPPPPVRNYMDGKPTLKVFCLAKCGYALTIRADQVVLAPSNPSDLHQHWIKFGTSVKDKQGHSSFALVNKASGQAMKHTVDATYPVQLTEYNPDKLDVSALWTENQEVEGYSIVSMVNSINLYVDAFNGDKNHGGVHDVVLWEWLNDSYQRWIMAPY